MRVLDFKGLKCPIPVLKAFKVVKGEKEISRASGQKGKYMAHNIRSLG